MSRLIMILLILGAILFWWHWSHAPDAAGRKRLLQNTLFGGLIAAVLLLAVTGHLHWLGVVLAGLLALIRQSLPLLLRYFPLIAEMYRTKASSAHASARDKQVVPSSSMTVEEALQVLGLSGTPTREEITQAYRRVMQQMHPDRGGNEYFAAKVNQAREVLNARFG